MDIAVDTAAHKDMVAFYKGKAIAVTGGGGSIGAEIVRQLLSMPVTKVRILDNHESAIFHLLEELGHQSGRLETFYCDIRDEQEVGRTLSGMDYCFHAAALKHVPFCEASPFGAVQTNILGTQAIIRAALANRLERVLMTSTDKAVNPTNVMGTSKLMGERLFTAANALSEGSHRCQFSAVRFGNVAGSHGSVMPVFIRQIASGQAITVTDPNMTRFVMSLSEAVRLVLLAMTAMHGGEIFITKMPVLRIIDLAEVMIQDLAPLFGRKPADVPITVIGARLGEKMWEELTTEEEVRRTYDIGPFLSLLPVPTPVAPVYAHGGTEPPALITHNYHSRSEIAMSKDDISAFLRQPGILPEDLRLKLVAS
jgi:FlaA1/EpsC-like NDP-sugar epimerase